MVALGDARRNRAFRIDQFAARFNRPDLILRRLGLGDEATLNALEAGHRRRLARLGDPKELSKELTVPQARITGAAVSDERIAKLEFTLESSAVPLRAYHVYVNGVPQTGADGHLVSGSAFTGVESVALSPGQNMIELSCLDAAGSESIRDVRVVTGPKAGSGRLVFVGLGVSNYRDPAINDLKFAHKDVIDLANAFTLGAKGHVFSEVQTHVFTDERATRGCLGEIAEFLRGTRVEDTLVIFIAGHGVRDAGSGTYYYLPCDARLAALGDSAVPFEGIERLLFAAPARSKLLLMDTCESGDVDEVKATATSRTLASRGLAARTVSAPRVTAPAVMAQPLDRDRFLFVDLLRRSGAVVIASCKGTEAALESDKLQNGLFTKAILSTLTNPKADIDGNGLLSPAELLQAIGPTVQRMSGGSQSPNIRHDNIHQRPMLPLLETR